MSQLLVDDIVDKDGGNSVGFSKGINVSASSNITGNLNVTGVLTYEDVTNVDAVGLITARSGIKFGAAGVGGTIRANGDTTLAGVVTATSFSGDGSALTGMANTANVSTSGLNVVGVATIGGDASIADKIVHTGDTDTAIRFSAADTIRAETGGTARLEVDSTGRVSINEVGTYNDAAEYLLIKDSATACNVSIVGSNDTHSTLNMGDEDDFNIQKIKSDHTDNSLQFYTNDSERLRIKSNGDVTIGTGVTISSAGICTVTTGTDLNGYKVEEGSYDTNALNGEFDFELENGHVQTHTGSTAGTYFPDFRVSSSQSLSSVMDVGDVVTATLIVTASNASHYCTAGIKIDNSTSNVTVEWIGSSAASAGKGAGYDIYSFTIQKTAATPAYLVIVNATDAG